MDFKLHDKIIPLPNIDKDSWHEKYYEGRNLADLMHPFKIVCCSPPNAGKTTAIMNIFMRCQLGKTPFETLIVIQPDTSHEYDQLDPTFFFFFEIINTLIVKGGSIRTLWMCRG